MPYEREKCGVDEISEGMRTSMGRLSVCKEIEKVIEKLLCGLVNLLLSLLVNVNVGV